MLSTENKNKVVTFSDIDENKIGTTYPYCDVCYACCHVMHFTVVCFVVMRLNHCVAFYYRFVCPHGLRSIHCVELYSVEVCYTVLTLLRFCVACFGVLHWVYCVELNCFYKCKICKFKIKAQNTNNTLFTNKTTVCGLCGYGQNGWWVGKSCKKYEFGRRCTLFSL